MIIKKMKQGMAMIELIFALVIMGIVLLSAPMLIQQSIQSSNIALQQESIAAIASHTGILLSKHWDEGDTNLSAGVAPIITLTNPLVNSPYNLEGIDFDKNVSGRTSTVADVNITASALGQDSGDFDDIDDYTGFDVNLTVFNNENSTNAGLGDYVDTMIRIATEVTYADDRPNGGTLSSNVNAANNLFTTPSLGVGIESQIKYIQTTLTTNSTVEELDKTITLHAFSSNLGTYSLGGEQY
ncbi:MAG: Unknown protein [uncultured Sulfurovum sp.]|uniref:Uncharacterized protein n=1 Tax=uncultured Sulfurovum sp. TaxID=269237 RepID=A0A6S6U395_9BACT|nr:MAG: Unknown protein [uncultured Sulfurovum sp.]